MFNSQRQSGMALLITLAVISVLMAAALELNRKVRSAVMLTATVRDKATLRQMSLAGVHAASALLVLDKKESAIDSLQEDWAQAETLEQLLKEIPFEEGKLDVRITDETSRIQVNALVKFPLGREFNPAQRGLWERFLDLLVPGDEEAEFEPQTVISALKDWLDSGDDDAITGLNGAESEHYQNLDPPYQCRNGPLQHLDELARVKGFRSEFFNSTPEQPSISALMTVHGSTPADNSFTFGGKININTAELPVLMALLPADNDDLAEPIADHRLLASDSEDDYVHDLSSPTWYKDAPGCSDIEIDPALITLQSDLFRIQTIAVLHDTRMVATTVVKREKSRDSGKWRCKLLSWQED